MISQVVVTRSTAPQQVELAEDVTRSRSDVRRSAKQMVKTNALPPQHPNSVSPDGLYVPVFSTLEGSWFAKSVKNKVEYIEGTKPMAIVLGVSPGLVGTMLLFGGDPAGGAFFLSVGGSLSGALLLSRKVLSTKALDLYKRMTDVAYMPFADWAKKRYGITVSEAMISEEGQNVIVAGSNKTYNPYQISSWLVDTQTSIKYTIRVRSDGQVFLSPYGSDVEAPLTANGAAMPPLMIGSLSSPVDLPKEALNLHEQLMASVALLKTQELSVEMAHQVERTESVVGVVLTKYASIAALKATEKARQDLVAFLQNQVEFVDGLIEQHADELTKQMGVEIAAVTEAGQHDTLLLEVKR
jgi:hypothetical protein